MRSPVRPREGEGEVKAEGQVYGGSECQVYGGSEVRFTVRVRVTFTVRVRVRGGTIYPLPHNVLSQAEREADTRSSKTLAKILVLFGQPESDLEHLITYLSEP